MRAIICVCRHSPVRIGDGRKIPIGIIGVGYRPATIIDSLRKAIGIVVCQLDRTTTGGINSRDVAHCNISSSEDNLITLSIADGLERCDVAKMINGAILQGQISDCKMRRFEFSDSVAIPAWSGERVPSHMIPRLLQSSV